MGDYGQIGRSSDRQSALLNHILECDICLAVIADLESDIEKCKVCCPEYRRLIREDLPCPTAPRRVEVSERPGDT
jgi:hypothetical protein